MSPSQAAIRSLVIDARIPDVLHDLPTRSLSPAQHASLILPAGSKGVLIAGKRDRVPTLSRTGEREYRMAYSQVGAAASEVAGAISAFDHGGEILVAMNSFRPRGTFGAPYSERPDKRLSNLLQLRACWVELDFYKRGEYRHCSAEEMVWTVLDRCREENVPLPSYVVSSGRGLHVVWLTEGVPSIALKAWRAVQKRLADGFHDMGPDRVGAVATSNLRLVGTVNRTVPVRMVWPATVGGIRRFSFRALSEEVLPYTPEQCREFREKAEARKVERKASATRRVANGGSPALSVETYRTAMEQDLWRLLDGRYPADMRIVRTEEDDGTHGRYLFAFARLWACRMTASELQAEVEARAVRLGFRRPSDAVTAVGAVIRRRKLLDQGKARKNRPETCGYTFGPQAFVREFDVTPDEARAFDLRILVPRAMKAERVAERQAKTRLRKGAKPRADAQAERLALGRQALALRDAEGLSRPQLCDRLGVKATLLDKAVREAKAAAAKPVPAAVEPKAKPKLPPRQAPSRVSSRFIETKPEVPAALDAVEVASYTGDVRAEAPPFEDTRPVGSERNGGPSHVEVQVIRRTPFFTEYRSATEAYGILREKSGGIWYEQRVELSLDTAPPPSSAPPGTSGANRIVEVLGQLSQASAADRRRAKRRGP